MVNDPPGAPDGFGRDSEASADADLVQRTAGGDRQAFETLYRRYAAPILREVHDVALEYERAFERAERARALLGELQGELQGDPRVKEIAPLRAELSDKLTYSSLDRLDSFLKLAADSQLKPEEKLALAFEFWEAVAANMPQWSQVESDDLKPAPPAS